MFTENSHLKKVKGSLFFIVSREKPRKNHLFYPGVLAILSESLRLLFIAQFELGPLFVFPFISGIPSENAW